MAEGEEHLSLGGLKLIILMYDGRTVLSPSQEMIVSLLHSALTISNGGLHASLMLRLHEQPIRPASPADSEPGAY